MPETAVNRPTLSERVRSWIISYRKETGISQGAFGAPLDVGRSCIHAIENGKNKPSVKLIEKIEKFYGVNFTD